MKSIPFDCPPEAFPHSFEGRVVLAVLEANGPKTPTVWLMFAITKGSTVEVFGLSSEGTDIPEELADLKPVVVAAAPSRPLQLI